VTEPRAEDYNMEDWCSVHGYEPVPEKYFRICGECGHVYLSAEELLAADAAVVAAIAQSAGAAGDTIPAELHAAQTVSQVHCCPLCTHDW
jgi:hypothetical protein